MHRFYKSFSLPQFLIIALLAMTAASCHHTDGEGNKPQQATSESRFKAGKDPVADTLSYALGRGYSTSREQLRGMLTNMNGNPDCVDQLIQGVCDGLNQKKAAYPDSAQDAKAFAYRIGYVNGQGMLNDIFRTANASAFGDDTTRHLSIQNFIAGFMDEVNGVETFKKDGSPLTQQNAHVIVNDLMQQLYESQVSKQYADWKRQNEAFMKKTAGQSGVKTLESGVCYRVLSEGKGPHPTTGNTVKFSYEGRLIDGTPFDKSEKPMEGKIGNFVPGFNIALSAMPVGAEWEIYIPWTQGYGTSSAGAIKPFSTLVFKVKLLSFK